MTHKEVYESANFAICRAEVGSAEIGENERKFFMYDDRETFIVIHEDSATLTLFGIPLGEISAEKANALLNEWCRQWA